MNFDAAWRAFVQNDAGVKAPATLEYRVLHAVGMPRTERRRESALLTSLLAAAAALVATVIVQRSVQEPPSMLLPARTLASDASLARLRSTVTGHPPVLVRDRPAPARRLEEPPVVTVTLEYPETLQIVRIRVPREALEPLGLVVLEPDTQAVVDVDVLIGEDGLPRGISQVRTNQE